LIINKSVIIEQQEKRVTREAFSPVKKSNPQSYPQILWVTFLLLFKTTAGATKLF
jgi:hypothetical protein